jgi:hypothetical protein
MFNLNENPTYLIDYSITKGRITDQMSSTTSSEHGTRAPESSARLGGKQSTNEMKILYQSIINLLNHHLFD